MMASMDVNNVSPGWWGKAAAAGAIGGLVMGLYLMGATALMGGGFWTPMNLIGGTFAAFRPVGEVFSAGPSLVGTLMHLVTAAAFGLIYGGLALTFFENGLSKMGTAAVSGLLYGAAVYLVMGLFVGPMIDPLITAMPPINYFVSHLIYGLVTAFALAMMSRRRTDVTIEHEPPAVSSPETIER